MTFTLISKMFRLQPIWNWGAWYLIDFRFKLQYLHWQRRKYYVLRSTYLSCSSESYGHLFKLLSSNLFRNRNYHMSTILINIRSTAGYYSKAKIVHNTIIAAWQFLNKILNTLAKAVKSAWSWEIKGHHTEDVRHTHTSSVNVFEIYNCMVYGFHLFV